MTVLATVVDPDGTSVDLTSERWAHICRRHPEISHLQAAVLQAVSGPDEIRHGGQTNERWFYLNGPGPSRWLKVAVAYEEGRGWITTAFPRRNLP